MSGLDKSDGGDDDDVDFDGIPDIDSGVDEKTFLNSGNAARELGISYPTLKRWIYRGRIKSIKDGFGHHKISLSEINRVRKHVRRTHEKMIVELLNKRVAAYTNQIQMILESQFSHGETHSKLMKLVKSGKVISFPRQFKNYRYTWYYLSSTPVDEASRVIEETEGLLDIYQDFNLERKIQLNDVSYNDYSEYLVEQSMVAAGFKVVAKETNYFDGKAVFFGGRRGPPRTLDFIICKPSHSVFIGVQVKNKFDSPSQSDFDQLNDLCTGLGLKPMMVCRTCEPRFFVPMKGKGGRIIVFKRQLLKPGLDRNHFDKLNEKGFPIGIYRNPPDFLIKQFRRSVRVFK